MNNLDRAKVHINYAERYLKEIKQEINEKERRLRAISKMELPNKAIANMLDVSERTVTRMLKDGRLKSRMADDILEYQKLH